VLPDDDELRKHAANAIARHSRRGWRIDKPSKETHVDAVIALCMALEALENQPPPTRLLGWLDRDGFHPVDEAEDEDEAARGAAVSVAAGTSRPAATTRAAGHGHRLLGGCAAGSCRSSGAG
jgi:hypothetical protein